MSTTPVTGHSGLPLNVNDIVQFKNPNPLASPAFLVGMISSTNPGNSTVNITYFVPGGLGTTAVLNNIAVKFVINVKAAAGPANAESVNFSN